MAEEEWLTVEQAAKHVKCGVGSIYLAVKLGKLRVVRINRGRAFRFKRAWVDEWLVKSATPVER